MSQLIFGSKSKLEFSLLLRPLKIQLAYEAIICGDAGDPVDIASFPSTQKHFREFDAQAF